MVGIISVSEIIQFSVGDYRGRDHFGVEDYFEFKEYIAFEDYFDFGDNYGVGIISWLNLDNFGICIILGSGLFRVWIGNHIEVDMEIILMDRFGDHQYKHVVWGKTR